VRLEALLRERVTLPLGEAVQRLEVFFWHGGVVEFDLRFGLEQGVLDACAAWDEQRCGHTHEVQSALHGLEELLSAGVNGSHCVFVLGAFASEFMDFFMAVSFMLMRALMTLHLV
jgi:hypothetical protein